MSSLSPGKWFKKVPMEYRDNLKFRKRLLELCRHDREAQQAVIYACKRDILFFINTFCLQFNPLIKGDTSVGPFITWPEQERILLMEPPIGKGILWCYENDRTSVVEKSRDMGASWLFLIFQLWLCLFHNHIQVLNISRSKDAVDSNSRNSLFEKIRFMLRHIPDWMKGEVEQTKANFRFSRTGSEITGEASTGKSGAGGRASVVFIDEFSQIDEAIAVRQNTASISDCRFFNGTHLGVGTEFYNLTQSPEIVQIRLHWTRHPKKNKQLYSWDIENQRPKFYRYNPYVDLLEESRQPEEPMPEDYPYDRTGQPSGGPHPGIRSVWYDKKAAEIGTARQVAMELDINASGASSQFYDAMTIKRLQEKCRDAVWTGELDFDPIEARPQQFFQADNGSLRLWIEPQSPNANGKLDFIAPSSYVIGLDVSYGNGATPTCLTIFDVLKGLKVGMYVNAWKDPKQMAPFAVALCRMFKSVTGEPAYLGWEVPGPGYVFGQAVLEDFEFRNVYWNITNSWHDRNVQKVSERPGWTANKDNKVKIHNAYQNALRSGEFVNWDKQSLQETLSYVHYKGAIEHPKAQKNDDASAEGANHGDRVVADALAWMLAQQVGSRIEQAKPKEPPVLPNSLAGRRLLNRLRERESLSIWQRN